MPDTPAPDHPATGSGLPADPVWQELDLARLLPPSRQHDRQLVRSLALVLEARGIACQPLPAGKPQRLLVRERDHNAALREIVLFLQENRPSPRLPERFGLFGDNTLQTLSILLLIAIFHNITYLRLSGFGHTPIDWLQLGAADAGLIRQGEWWRAITALTLHADYEHLLGNLLLGGYFVIRLCRLLGGGMGWTLILWSGVLGNLVNALLQDVGHRSVGASTALFGAIGAAGIIGLLRHKESRSRFWLLPIAAALGLLAMLGAGGGDGDRVTDIGAHLFGFACGIGIGAVAGRRILQRGLPSARVNRLLGGGAILTVAVAWLLALTLSSSG